MKITIEIEESENELQLNKAFENVQWPEYSDRTVDVVLDAPKIQKFVNCFLNSNINARVIITPPSEDIQSVNYAGMFSGCTQLNRQPVFDGKKNRSMAAFFKSCENMRFNTYGIDTSNVVDFRQCFYGAKNFSGIGVAYWDFSSARSPDAFNNFFGGGSKMRTLYYDQFIEALYEQMKSGTLPTPMKSVDMGESQYSPLVAKKYKELIEYGWEFKDSGEVPYQLSPLEIEFSRSIDSRLKAGTFPGDIDFGPVCISPRNGILISPRHMLHVRHYMPSAGESRKLISGETVVVDKVESGYKGLDIGIVTLKEDAKTRPALVLPRNWKTAMPLLGGPPTQYPRGAAPAMIRFRQRGEPTINDATYAQKDPIISPSTGCTKPLDPLRLEYFKDIQMGDSGSPVCFVYKDRLVASYSLATSGGTGVFLAGVREWVDELCARTGHSVEECPIE